MPAIRSSLSRSSSPIPPSSPRGSESGGVQYRYRRVLGDELGAPFKEMYDDTVDPEFSCAPDPRIAPIPKDPRPPSLSLKDLECIRTLGEGQGKVLLISSKKRDHKLDNGTVFALKAIPRQTYRKQAITLLSRKSRMDPVTANSLVSDHMFAKDLERSNLVGLPWNPFVTGLIQTFEDSRMLYMALEFIPGGTLRSLIRKAKGGFDVTKANFYFGNIVCALEFLHQNGVAHRDLKPENILLAPDGYLCLTDFGSSARFEYDECQWNDVGTPFYMAPECNMTSIYYISHPPFERPAAVDWWSSGCILYEMITGKLAFCESDSLMTGMRASMGIDAVDWPSDIRVGNKLRSLVGGLLEANPEERLGSTGQMDVKDHAWLSNIDWLKLYRRGYMAPFIPKPTDLSERWHDASLPEQVHVPGLKVIEPPLHLANDNRFPERPYL